MRTASLTAAATLFLAATPAFATSSIHCRTGRGGPDIWLVVPNERGAGIDQARITFGREELVARAAPRARPWIASSRVDRRRLSILIVLGRGAHTTTAGLVATRRGVPYVGDLIGWRRTWRVRCYWDEDDPG
jgi:hypothetical protein